MKSRIPYTVFRILYFVFCILFTAYSLQFIAYGQESSDYVKKAWALRGAKKYEEAHKVINECLSAFSLKAEELAKTLSAAPPHAEESYYKVMIDVAECYFIRGEVLRAQGKIEEAVKAFETIIAKYPHAQAFDPRGGYWSLKDTAKIAIDQLRKKVEEENDEEAIIITNVVLYEKGEEFPVNYFNYGKFKDIGTKNYKYVIDNPVGLAKATGEGIYPNTTSVKFDPEYVKIKSKLFKIDHWKILNSRDLNTAFYKWNFAPEAAATKQFYISEILEKSGLIKQAIKGYYSIVVHFPRSYSWTYWHTPWYVAKAALYRLKYLLKNNPELNLKLVDADIQVINGYDNDIRNDVFIVNPGKLAKLSFWDKKFSRRKCGQKRKKLGKIVSEKGKKVKLVKYESGDWQLFVKDKPFMIKGITYGPTRVGESPDDGTMQNWTIQDINKNELIDSPQDSWVDENRNNVQDKSEKAVGDLYLISQMGVNALRLYHQPFKLNKKILGQMHEKYGIYVIMGDFLGKYTLGSKADWEKGTDYDNPEHRKNMLKSIKNMVMEFKDEPYVLMWLLGNENVYGLGCNADKKPESFFQFANEAAFLIKSLDSEKRPVAIASGDILYLDIFAKNCPDIDIFGTNSYRGKYGFLDIWDEVRRVSDKPVMITEYGTSSYAKGYSQEEAENYQASYHKACWLNINCNSYGFGAGNSIGGIVFEWLDEWWKAYEPAYHDKKGLFSGPFLDGYMHEEWLGIAGQGDGKKSPYLRQLKKAYYTYKELWNN